MDYLALARTVIELEIAEIQRLRQRLNETFIRAVEALRTAVDAGRKIIICGVGKSGNVAFKIAATLTSTGAPAVVLNTQDALHGDLGLVNDGDVIIAMSASGETDEMINLLPHLKRLQTTLIAMTGGADSLLARSADIVLDVNVEREACPLNLAPTSSSTVMLVLGDALAMVLLEARGFKAGDFARLHPGGSLGRALLTKVSDIMRKGERLPLVDADATVMDAVRTMTRCRSGCVIITEPSGEMAGIFTQGDFTRAYESHPDIAGTPVSQFMIRRPITIQSDRLAAEILNILERHPVDELVVLDEARIPVGIVDTQDLSRFRIL
ncbi:MAG TPA: KpsF/GutQ family sugar-phosphate isomerase [Verrucomicrobiales bacterium]|nr:KpsF/GutQ family sugar-phosphate isomerase [Verrucomicrobiales bacterium]